VPGPVTGWEFTSLVLILVQLAQPMPPSVLPPPLFNVPQDIPCSHPQQTLALLPSQIVLSIYQPLSVPHVSPDITSVQLHVLWVVKVWQQPVLPIPLVLSNIVMPSPPQLYLVLPLPVHLVSPLISQQTDTFLHQPLGVLPVLPMLQLVPVLPLLFLLLV
jgi:hypothetical protein